MKTSFSKEQIIAAVTTALLFISLIGIGYYYNANSSLKGGLNQEKLRSESLLSEKLSLSKEAEKLKADIVSWKGKSKEADSKLDNDLKRITEMEGTIRNLRRDNASLQSLRNELAELKKIRTDLEAHIANLEGTNKAKENRINELTAELSSLQSELAETRKKILPVNITDNFRIESQRGRKNRLTVNAARTKRMVVSFEIPMAMTENVSFQITTPDGEHITSDSKALTHEVIEDGRNFIASLSPLTGEFEVSKRVEMTYSPHNKLEPGIYTIDILHNGVKSGRSQVRLR